MNVLSIIFMSVSESSNILSSTLSSRVRTTRAQPLPTLARVVCEGKLIARLTQYNPNRTRSLVCATVNKSSNAQVLEHARHYVSWAVTAGSGFDLWNMSAIVANGFS